MIADNNILFYCFERCRTYCISHIDLSPAPDVPVAVMNLVKIAALVLIPLVVFVLYKKLR